MKKKECNSCGRVLTTDHFHRNGSRFRPSCKFCRRKQRKVSESKPAARYKTYKRNSKSRGIEFELTEEYFFSFDGKSCFYCGEELSAISLDRIDNDVGYVEGNVVPCCYICNSFKHVFSEESFLKHVEKIFSYQNRKNENDKQEGTIKKVGEENIADTKGSCPSC